jgi:hypothetical protein
MIGAYFPSLGSSLVLQALRALNAQSAKVSTERQIVDEFEHSLRSCAPTRQPLRRAQARASLLKAGSQPESVHSPKWIPEYSRAPGMLTYSSYEDPKALSGFGETLDSRED